MSEENNDLVEEEPEGPPDLGILYRRFLEQVQRFQRRENIQAAGDYRRAMRDWNRNLAKHGYDEEKLEAMLGRDRPEPALAIQYFGHADFTVIKVVGPGLVHTLIPIVGPPEPPPAGLVEFGHRVPRWPTEAYWIGRSTVPVGHVATKDGKDFVMIELGERGQLFWSLIWELVGD